MDRRGAIEAVLRAYPTWQAQFRYLSRKEYVVLGRVHEDLPTDSVRSPNWEGLPQGQGVPSDPTGQVVLTREEIVRRRQAAAATILEADAERLHALADRLILVAELVAALDQRERTLVELYYWRRNRQVAIAEWFAEHEAEWVGWPVPRTQREVSRDLDILLLKIEAVWEPWPPELPE